MVDVFEKENNDTPIIKKEPIPLSEDFKDKETTANIKVLETPGENISNFSIIIQSNRLLYKDLGIEDQTKVREGLQKRKDFLVNKLSTIQNELNNTKEQVDFINIFYILLNTQKYEQGNGVDNIQIDTNKYGEIINKNLVLRLDYFSKDNSKYNKDGFDLSGSDISNAEIFGKLLTIMQNISVEDKISCNTVLANYISTTNQHIQKEIDKYGISFGVSGDYIYYIKQCLETQKFINDGKISDVCKKNTEDTIAIVQKLLESKKKDIKTDYKDRDILSQYVFYIIELSQNLGENEKYMPLLHDIGKIIDTPITLNDIKKEIQGNLSEKDINTKNSLENDEFYKQIDKVCSEYNSTAQALELNKSYQFKKNKYSIDLTFKDNKYKTKLILEKTAEYRVKVTYGTGSILLEPHFLIEKIEHEDIQSIVEEIEQKEKNTTKEKNNILKNFDLPKDEPIQYTRIFQNNDGMGLVGGILGFSEAIAQELEKNYPKIKTSNPEITGDPETVMRSTIKNNYPAQKNFFFDLYSHGTPTHLAFEKPLTADIIIQLSKEYPDCKFYISTIGCYGGGLIDLTKESKDLKNLYIFTQTKNYLPNTPSRGTTIYSITLLKGLQEGNTYGEAVYEADKIVNELNYSDAETFLGGEYIAETKKVNKETFQTT
ncbi:MAG: hypothetical protein NT085_00780 [candidate division SR1 bacterium]|nr:hypothetical protein [candidate division SR1 bacterium]